VPEFRSLTNGAAAAAGRTAGGLVIHQHCAARHSYSVQLHVARGIHAAADQMAVCCTGLSRGVAPASVLDMAKASAPAHLVRRVLGGNTAAVNCKAQRGRCAVSTTSGGSFPRIPHGSLTGLRVTSCS